MFPVYVTPAALLGDHYSTDGYLPRGCFAVVYHDTYTDFAGACCGRTPVVFRLRALSAAEEEKVQAAVAASIGTWMHAETVAWRTPKTPDGGEWTTTSHHAEEIDPQKSLAAAGISVPT